METECVNINGVPTKVLTWGKKLNDPDVSKKQIDLNFIICIPGNPGITEFYKEFLTEIYKETDNNVWIVGHAGHEIINSIPLPKENKDLYSLQAQIKHKISFIEKFMPPDAKLTLIGHSIGCYIILKLLQVPSIQSRVVKSYLLYPTFENMAESKNGIILVRFVKYFKSFLLPLVMLFNIFPLVIQNFLLCIYCKASKMPYDYRDIIRNFVKPHPVFNSISMAHEEMLQVRERDNTTLRANADRIKLYYGVDDGWAPLTYYEKLKSDIPDINAEVSDNGLPHAFVIHGSKLMAHLILTWMKAE